METPLLATYMAKKIVNGKEQILCKAVKMVSWLCSITHECTTWVELGSWFSLPILDRSEPLSALRT